MTGSWYTRLRLLSSAHKVPTHRFIHSAAAIFNYIVHMLTRVQSDKYLPENANIRILGADRFMAARKKPKTALARLAPSDSSRICITTASICNRGRDKGNQSLFHSSQRSAEPHNWFTCCSAALAIHSARGHYARAMCARCPASVTGSPIVKRSTVLRHRRTGNLNKCYSLFGVE